MEVKPKIHRECELHNFKCVVDDVQHHGEYLCKIRMNTLLGGGITLKRALAKTRDLKKFAELERKEMEMYDDIALLSREIRNDKRIGRKEKMKFGRYMTIESFYKF